MPIQVKCSCGKQLRVPDDYLGKRVKCPACGSTQTVQATTGGEVTAAQPSGMVRFSCGCGKQMQTRAEHAGSIVQCPSCGGEVTVPGGKRPRREEPAISTERSPQRSALDFRDDDPADRPRERRGRRKQGGKTWLVVGGLCLLLLLVGGGIAAYFLFFAGVSDDMALIPADAQGFVTVRVADVYKSDVVKTGLDAAPPEAKEQMKEMEGKLGLTLADVERVTFVIKDAKNESMWVIFRTSKAYDIEKIKSTMKETSPNGDFEEKTYKGKKYFQMKDGVLYPVSDKILVVAPDKAIEACINQQESPVTKGRLADAIKEADSSDHFVVAFADPMTAFAPAMMLGARDAGMRPVARNFPADDVELMQQHFPVKEPFPDASRIKARAFPEEDFPPVPPIPGGAPPMFAQFGPGGPPGMGDGPEAALTVVQDLKLVMLVGNISDKLDLTLTGTFGKEDNAKKAKEMLDGFKVMAGFMIGELNAKSPEVGKLAGSIMEKLTIEHSGEDVIVSLKGVDVSKDTITPIINEALKNVMGAAGNAQGLNNLKQMGLAMHTFHDAHGYLPPMQANPQFRHPNLSWRVDLLPYIEYDNLYKQIRLNEPYDSPHNRRFWSQMPITYASPGMDPTLGQTRYQVFRGQNTPFNGQRQTFVSILDGTSNTIMIAEASRPVNWMAPDDISFQQSPGGFQAFNLGSPGKSVFLVAMCDGSTRQIPKSIDPITLQSMITANQGETFNLP